MAKNTEPKPRKRRLGDRSDGYLIRNIPPMTRIEPYIMKKRYDAILLQRPYPSEKPKDTAEKRFVLVIPTLECCTSFLPHTFVLLQNILQ